MSRRIERERRGVNEQRIERERRGVNEQEDGERKTRSK